MKKTLLALLLTLGLIAGVTPPASAQCVSTTNLGLCKGARSQLDWDTFLNANFDIIDGQLINTGSTSQTKTGTLTLSHITPLKLTGAGFYPGEILFLGPNNNLQADLVLFWDDSNNRLGIGTNTPTTTLDVVGTVTLTGLKLAASAGAGKVLTSDGSGNASWQTPGAVSVGWTDGGTSVYLTTNTDNVSLTDSSATEKLEVGGGVVLGAALATQTGTIQWSGTHFQGYNGSAWVDLDYSAAAAGGWTDAGTEVNLTGATDLVGIGGSAVATGKVTIIPDTDLSGLIISGYSATGASANPILSLSGTWNTTASPTGIYLAVTNTASGVSTKLMDLLVGAVSKFSVSKAGEVVAEALTIAGNITTATFKMTTGAAAGYILTSDASGNATWQASGASSGVPSGMIAMFDSACPSGWTSISGVGGTMENRFPYGVATYTGVAGGASTHTHSVDVGNTASSTDGAHTHAVDPPNTTTSYPSATGLANETPPTTKTLAEDHTHTVDIASFTSGSGGSHFHYTDPAAVTSASASSLPPYMGLVYCKKN